MNQHIAETGQWATFLLGDEHFAVPVEDVQEVLLAQPLAPVPLAPIQIVGLLNLRGAIMPAIDLRVRLGFPPAASNSQQKFLVLKAHGGLVSIVVDEIGDVLELKGEQWRSVPDTLDASHRNFVFGIYPLDGQMLLGLRVARLCADDAGDIQAAA
jgi:purine-binding chemotaxis protein CheW